MVKTEVVAMVAALSVKVLEAAALAAVLAASTVAMVAAAVGRKSF